MTGTCSSQTVCQIPRYTRVPDTFIAKFLLAMQLVTLGSILNAQNNFILTVRIERVGDVERKRCVATTMRANLFSIQPNLCGRNRQLQSLQRSLRGFRFRRRKGATIPYDLIGLN